MIALAVIWLVHIGADRMLGYGLKYDADFSFTHLGRIGRAAAFCTASATAACAAATGLGACGCIGSSGSGAVVETVMVVGLVGLPLATAPVVSGWAAMPATSGYSGGAPSSGAGK